MKKHIIIAVSAILCVCMTGCAQLPPAQASDGTAWNDSWVTVGNVVGVETPEGVTLTENNDALGDKGMYYATWSIGEETPYVNADGDDAKIYDAQIYLLLAGYDAADKAKDALDGWQSMADSAYSVEETAEAVCGGQNFTVMTYTYASEANPYQRGASAFGVYRNYAINVEISCLESFDGDARALLENFLEHCHYAA